MTAITRPPPRAAPPLDPKTPTDEPILVPGIPDVANSLYSRCAARVRRRLRRCSRRASAVAAASASAATSPGVIRASLRAEASCNASETSSRTVPVGFPRRTSSLSSVAKSRAPNFPVCELAASEATSSSASPSSRERLHAAASDTRREVNGAVISVTFDTKRSCMLVI